MSSDNKILDALFVKICHKLKNHDKQLKENFQRLPTNFDRFKFIWCLQIAHAEFDAILEQTYYDSKDTIKSNEYRQLGNDLYGKKRFAEAIEKYNLSIKYAVNPTLKIKLEEVTNENAPEAEVGLAISYANRSAVFFHMNELVLSLADIELAFKCGYPLQSRFKLIERKLACLYKLGNYDLVLDLIEKEKSLELEIFQSYIKIISDIKRMNAVKEEKTCDEAVKQYLDAHLDVTFEIPAEEKSSNIVCASRLISIDYGIEKGFFIKSNEDIEAGELIVDEPPYASVLLGENIKDFCYECQKKLEPLKQNLNYCRQCVNVTYCSKDCEKASWLSHRHECKYIKLLAFNSGLTHMEWLAMRIVLKATFDFLHSERDFFVDYEVKREIFIRDDNSMRFHDEDSRKLYRSDLYFNIFHLITNSVLRVDNELFRRAFISLFLVKILLKTNFIQIKNSNNPTDLRDNACFIGGLILRHLQSISCNAHEISMLKLDEESRKPLANSYANGIGAGIYAVLSIFNHSCDPHVTRNFVGSKCQVRTIRKVKKDEQVFDNYGVVYAVNELEERKAKLMNQYFFECRCVCCLDHWPLYDSIPKDLKALGIKCNECKIKKTAVKNCSGCENEFDNLKMHQYQAESSLGNFLFIKKKLNLTDLNTMKQVDTMFENWYSYLQLLESHQIKRPFQDFNNYQEALKQLLNLIYMK